jgi:hypothetical protein
MGEILSLWRSARKMLNFQTIQNGQFPHITCPIALIHVASHQGLQKVSYDMSLSGMPNNIFE